MSLIFTISKCILMLIPTLFMYAYFSTSVICCALYYLFSSHLPIVLGFDQFTMKGTSTAMLITLVLGVLAYAALGALPTEDRPRPHYQEKRKR
jgi:hypothetical protein